MQKQRQIDKIAHAGKSSPAKYGKEKISHEDIAAQNMIVKRIHSGMLFCLAKLPKEKRTKIPDKFNMVWNWIDGKRNMQEVFKLTEYELNEKLNNKKVLLNFVCLLEKYGYLSLKYRKKLTGFQIKKALRKLENKVLK